MTFPCPNCNALMNDSVPSLLAPVYRTHFCESCGGLFYELMDKSELQKIQASVIQKTLEKAEPMLKGLVEEMQD